MAEFKGCFTAIITPYVGTGIRTPVDWDAFRQLIELQDKGKISGIIACGTTGESPTLSHEEHNKVISATVEHAKCLVVAGTGSNCTWEAIEMTKHAEDTGADASLQVCPYYNKPNQEGLFRHFGAVADSVDIPIILYNIPGRSGKEISPETMLRLSEEYSNVIGVKEASGKEETWKKIREVCGEKFLVLSGNDGDTFKMMRDYKARGVISVASNVAPKLMVDFVALGLQGKWQEMEAQNGRLKEFFDALFLDTNPICVKIALNLMGVKAGGFRYPLCETSEENAAKVKAALKKMGLAK
jgi:4-hydroxy-tetrahydrodipicolinate synthase